MRGSGSTSLNGLVRIETLWALRKAHKFYTGSTSLNGLVRIETSSRTRTWLANFSRSTSLNGLVRIETVEQWKKERKMLEAPALTGW